MRVIPAIDILDGQCVRLIQGDYSRRMYYSSVSEAVDTFSEAGASELHLVDLDAAKSGDQLNLEIISQVARRFGGQIQVGGGVRSFEAAQRYFDTGATRVVVGSAALDQPEMFRGLCESYGGRIVAALDYRRRGGKIYVTTHGWLSDSEVELSAAIAMVISMGTSHILATDVSKDGTFQGPDIETYRWILSTYDVVLTASGGVGSYADLEALNEVGVDGRGIDAVVVGRAFHDGRISVSEVMTRWNR